MASEEGKKTLRYTLGALGLSAIVGGAMFYYAQEMYGAGEKAWSEITTLMKPAPKPPKCFSTTITVVEVEEWRDSPFERQKVIERSFINMHDVVLFDPIEGKYILSSFPTWRFKEKGKINYCPP